MLVGDIMTRGAVTAHPETRVKDALRQLGDRRITALPVVDDRDELVGIVSEADLLRESFLGASRPTGDDATGDRPHRTPRVVRDVMTRAVVSATPHQLVADVLRSMLGRGIHSVPVVHDGRVVGILSRSDIVRALALADQWIADDVAAKLQDIGLRGWSCDVENGHVFLAGGSHDDARLAISIAGDVAGVRSVVVYRAR